MMMMMMMSMTRDSSLLVVVGVTSYHLSIYSVSAKVTSRLHLVSETVRAEGGGQEKNKKKIKCDGLVFCSLILRMFWVVSLLCVLFYL